MRLTYWEPMVAALPPATAICALAAWKVPRIVKLPLPCKFSVMTPVPVTLKASFAVGSRTMK